ncbi:MAG: sugar phosphate isomerase/epimerase [Candidatus Nezhaarchaeota archaeon]|nr:sugar phosphate isomerase/epimerase [Candidatus Nezhaarchaeota archaeon]
MLIGFPLWLGDRKRFEAKVKEAHDAGFDFIELSFDYPWPIPDYLTPKRIAKFIQDTGLDLAIHGSWRDIRLASPIDQVREASLDYVLRTLEMAKELEPRYVVFHVSTDQAVKEVEELEQLAINAALQSVKRIADLALKLGITVLIENTPLQFSSSIEQMKRIVLSVEGLNVCLDIGHAQIQAMKLNNHVKVSVSDIVKKWVEELGSRILGVHVHDCVIRRSRIDEHITPSTNSQSIRSLMDIVRSGNLRLKFAVIEAFKDVEGREASPGSLVSIVRQLKELNI